MIASSEQIWPFQSLYTFRTPIIRFFVVCFQYELLFMIQTPAKFSFTNYRKVTSFVAFRTKPEHWNSQHENDIAKNSLCDDSFLSFSVCNAAYLENEKLLKSFLEPNNLIIRRKPPRESNSSIFVQNASMYSPCFSRNRSHNEHFEQFSHSKLNRKAK